MLITARRVFFILHVIDKVAFIMADDFEWYDSIRQGLISLTEWRHWVYETTKLWITFLKKKKKNLQ